MADGLEKRSVIATYADLTSAQRVVERLLRGGFERDDIRIYRKPQTADPANPDTGEMMGEHRALVRVEVIAGRVEPATEIMNAEPPTLLQVGGENWRGADWARLIPGLRPLRAARPRLWRRAGQRLGLSGTL